MHILQTQFTIYTAFKETRYGMEKAQSQIPNGEHETISNGKKTHRLRSNFDMIVCHAFRFKTDLVIRPSEESEKQSMFGKWASEVNSANIGLSATCSPFLKLSSTGVIGDAKDLGYGPSSFATTQKCFLLLKPNYKTSTKPFSPIDNVISGNSKSSQEQAQRGKNDINSFSIADSLRHSIKERSEANKLGDSGILLELSETAIIYYDWNSGILENRLSINIDPQKLSSSEEQLQTILHKLSLTYQEAIDDVELIDSLDNLGRNLIPLAPFEFNWFQEWCLSKKKKAKKGWLRSLEKNSRSMYLITGKSINFYFSQTKTTNAIEITDNDLKYYLQEQNEETNLRIPQDPDVIRVGSNLGGSIAIVGDGTPAFILSRIFWNWRLATLYWTTFDWFYNRLAMGFTKISSTGRKGARAIKKYIKIQRESFIIAQGMITESNTNNIADEATTKIMFSTQSSLYGLEDLAKKVQGLLKNIITEFQFIYQQKRQKNETYFKWVLGLLAIATGTGRIAPELTKIDPNWEFLEKDLTWVSIIMFAFTITYVLYIFLSNLINRD